MKSKDIGAADVHPDKRTRKQHIQIISALKKRSVSDATKYWLDYCPRISLKAFKAA